MRKWLIVALSMAWLGWELYAANDHNPHTWPLTQMLITYVPAWLTIPAALILGVWLPWHLWTEYRKKRRREQTVTVALIRTGRSRQRKEIRPINGPHRNDAQ